MNTFLRAATHKATVLTSAKVAVIVGTILALINYGDRIFVHYDMTAVDWIKVVVTYAVPYCVATYGAARFAMRHSGRA
jgi:cystathionine beta-lyase/cystathionine gamma-synthase